MENCKSNKQTQTHAPPSEGAEPPSEIARSLTELASELASSLVESLLLLEQSSSPPSVKPSEVWSSEGSVVEVESTLDAAATGFLGISGVRSWASLRSL